MVSHFLFAFFYLFSASIFCANNNISQLIVEFGDAYFKPMQEHQDLVRKASLLKTQAPEKSKEVVILERQMLEKKYLENFCLNFHQHKVKQKNVIIENQVFVKKFWQKKQIEMVLSFKNHYETLDQQIKSTQSQLEAIKLNEPSYSLYNEIIQELINAEIEPLKTKYDEDYEFDLQNVYNKVESNNPCLEEINWEKSCNDICVNFLKKTSGATLDNMGSEFFKKIFTIFTSITKNNFTNNHQPNSKAIQSFFQTIIANIVVFSGCVEYYKSLADQGYPNEIKIKIAGSLSTEAVQYYSNRLQGKIKTEPQTYIIEIQKNCMTTISLALEPIVANKIQKKFSNCVVFDYIAQTICSSIFSGDEYKNYPHLMAIIDEIIENIVLPTDSEKIKRLIEIALCQTPNAIKEYKKKVAEESQILIDRQKTLEQELAQYANKREELNDQENLVNTQLLQLSKVQAENEQQKKTLNAQFEKLNETKQQLENRETELKKLQTNLTSLNSTLANKEITLQKKEADLNQQSQALEAREKKLNNQESRLNNQAQQPSDKARLQKIAKMVLYAAGLVATFLFLATLIQKKYQFIH